MTPQAIEGWYPDPEHPDQLRRWTGAAWDDPPMRPRYITADVEESATTTSKAGLEAANERRSSSLRIHAWYWLTCVLPLVLALVVPYRRADSELTHGFFGRMPSNIANPTTVAASELRTWAITAGWSLLAVGAVGVMAGAVLFAHARTDGSKAARGWFWFTVALAPVVLLLGLVLTAMTPALIYEPLQQGGGVIWGP